MGKHLYIYVVDRDFGFAPNPFHGFCTLATCVPRIRGSAMIGDWVMGVGGSRLKATGKCIYLMKISEALTFDEYWSDARFFRKKSVRNGSRVMMVGDNIYHHDADNSSWVQSDSHHSNSDGTANNYNLKIDTSYDRVLISEHFYYFGKSAPEVDLAKIDYKNHRSYSKKFLDDKKVSDFICNIEQGCKKNVNMVLDDPFDFYAAHKRIDQATRKIF